MSWWHVPQTSDSFGRKVVWNGAMVGLPDLPWMLWQFEHATLPSACLPDSQKASCRFVEWQARKTAVFSAAVPDLIRLAGLLLAGSFRCSVASPWQAWHMEPVASFFAPCAANVMDVCLSSWQFAQMGVTSGRLAATGVASAACWARAVPPKLASRTANPHAAIE